MAVSDLLAKTEKHEAVKLPERLNHYTDMGVVLEREVVRKNTALSIIRRRVKLIPKTKEQFDFLREIVGFDDQFNLQVGIVNRGAGQVDIELDLLVTRPKSKG